MRIFERKVGTAMPIHESREMYLETIYILSRKTAKLRAVNIVDYMGFSKPSVSRAIGILRRGGYITVDENGFITLTDRRAYLRAPHSAHRDAARSRSR